MGLAKTRSIIRYIKEASSSQPADQPLERGYLARELRSLLLAPNAVTDKAKLRSLVRPAKIGDQPTEALLDYFVSVLSATKAMYQGHFELLSGRHSEHFLIFNRVGSSPEAASVIVHELARRLAHTRPDFVIGPVSAGGLLVHDLADVLAAQPSFFDLDSVSRPMAIRSGYAVGRGSRVVIINDIATTGTGLEYMRRLLESNGAALVGIGLFATRGDMSVRSLNAFRQKWHIPIESLVHLDIDSVAMSECISCKVGKPVPQQSCILNC